MTAQAQVDHASVVLIGRFNPAIFSPSWLALNDLVSKPDADRAQIQIIHPEVAQFEVGELKVVSQLKKFSAACASSRREMIRDLIVGVFGQILVHTPIYAVGINREIHFSAGSLSVRDLVGDRLAPKSAWGQWGEDLKNKLDDDILQLGGLASMTMQQQRRNERRSGHIQATVQPSGVPSLGTSGIFLGVNNHYKIANEGDPVTSNQLLELLEEEWDEANAKSEFIFDQICSLVDQCTKTT